MFCGYEKAYDSVNREALWVALGRRYGLPMKILNILKALHRDTSGAVRPYGKVSKEFAIRNDVRQGDVLAPTLFNLFFDAVVSMALERNSGNGLTILFNTNAKLVGDRKQMRKQFLIIPILLYGSESWTPLSQHIKRLLGFVMRCLRIILGILVRQKQRNTDIWAKASIDTVDKMIRKRRLRWLGHVARMEPHCIPR